MKKFGIDISRWQKGLSLAQAQKEGVEFAILKIGGSDSGHYKDACFESFYLQAKSLGMPVGAYYFGKDLNVAQAQNSADHLIELLNGKQFEYPIYYDVEAKMLSLSKQQLTDVVNAFCKRVESAGYWVGIYSSLASFNGEFEADQISHWCKWIACWRKTQPKDADMWQFGGETNVIRSNKIAGHVCDQDYCYKDYPALIKAKGLNGFGKVNTPPAQTSGKKALYQVKVTASMLNVRAGASAKYRVLKAVKKNTVCNIFDVQAGWGKIDGGGWICLKYTKKL